MASPQSYKRPTLYSQGTEAVEIQIKQKFRLFFFFLLNRIIYCEVITTVRLVNISITLGNSFCVCVCVHMW